MKVKLNRKEIVGLGNAYNTVQQMLAIQNQAPEIAEKQNIDIQLSNKAMYRLGRNNDKIKSAYEAIGKVEKELLEKMEGKPDKSGLFVFKTGQKIAGEQAKGKESEELVDEYAPDQEKTAKFWKQYNEFLDEKDSEEEFDLMELPEEMFENGTGLTWENFFKAYEKLMT